MKNWKTTFIGAAMAVIIAVQPILETGQVNWKQIGFAALIAAFGYLAKDHNVTGGKVEQ